MAKYIVIGEGQSAIENYATQIRKDYPNHEYRTIKNDWKGIVKTSGANDEIFGTAEWEAKAVQGNSQWIKDMHNEGYEFIDIGKDAAPNRSPFYLAEKKALSDTGARCTRLLPSVLKRRELVPSRVIALRQSH